MCKDLDLQESDQELSRSSFASTPSSEFAKDVEGISHAASTLNHSSHIQCSHMRCGSEGGHSFVNPGAIDGDASFGTPVREAPSHSKEGTKPLNSKEGTQALMGQDSGLSCDESAVGADRSMLSVLPELAGAGLQAQILEKAM